MAESDLKWCSSDLVLDEELCDFLCPLFMDDNSDTSNLETVTHVLKCKQNRQKAIETLKQKRQKGLFGYHSRKRRKYTQKRNKTTGKFTTEQRFQWVPVTDLQPFPDG